MGSAAQGEICRLQAIPKIGRLRVGRTPSCSFAKNILGLCSRYDHPFAAINVGQVLSDFESGAQDTNDGFLIESCRQHGWKFVTNDGDFTEGGIEVLTNNPKLIAACP